MNDNNILIQQRKKARISQHSQSPFLVSEIYENFPENIRLFSATYEAPFAWARQVFCSVKTAKGLLEIYDGTYCFKLVTIVKITEEWILSDKSGHASKIFFKKRKNLRYFAFDGKLDYCIKNMGLKGKTIITAVFDWFSNSIRSICGKHIHR